MFRNLRKEKELIDREVEIYRQEKMNEITKKLVDMETKCLTDMAEYEHTYHSTMEERGIAIAKLEAQEEMLENDVNTYKMLIKEKDKEIERINKSMELLIKNQQQVHIHNK